MSEQPCPKCGATMKSVRSWSEPPRPEYECPVCHYSCTPEDARAEMQDESKIAIRKACQEKMLDAIADYKKYFGVVDQLFFRNWMHSLL